MILFRNILERSNIKNYFKLNTTETNEIELKNVLDIEKDTEDNGK